MKRSFAVLALVTVSLVGVSAQAATATFNATATAITPIAIAKTVDLQFGKFAAMTGGTIVMSPAGVRSATGAVVLSTVSPGASASFTVTGDANATYAITLPASATIASGANTMTVGTFTSTPATAGNLGAGGTQTLTAGGTLTVASGQVVGAYTGAFNMIVEYN